MAFRVLQGREPIHRGSVHEKLQQGRLLHHILRDNQLQSLQQPHGKKYQQYRNAQAQNAAAHQIQCVEPRQSLRQPQHPQQEPAHQHQDQKGR